jgi:hypothetical protein
VEKILSEAAGGLKTELSEGRLDLRELHGLSKARGGFLRKTLRASLSDAPSIK